jgi:hypothetical protein
MCPSSAKAAAAGPAEKAHCITHIISNSIIACSLAPAEKAARRSRAASAPTQGSGPSPCRSGATAPPLAAAAAAAAAAIAAAEEEWALGPGRARPVAAAPISVRTCGGGLRIRRLCI